MDDEEEQLRKEEERIARLQAKKQQASGVNKYATAVAAAKPAPKSGTFGGSDARAATPVHHAPQPVATPAHYTQPVLHNLVPVQQPAPPQSSYHPGSKVSEEPVEKVFRVTDDEMERREEERLMSRVKPGSSTFSPRTGPTSTVSPRQNPPASHPVASFSTSKGQNQPNSPRAPVPSVISEAFAHQPYLSQYMAPADEAPHPAPAPEKPQKKVLQDFEHPPSHSQIGTKFETVLLAELINVRLSPKTLIPRLQERKKHFHNENEYRNLYTETVMPTQEGTRGIDNAIAYLQQLPDLGTKARLRLEEGLSLSAKDFCDLQKGMKRVQESDDEAQGRLNKYGRFHGNILQNVAFCNVSAEDLIIDWIIDDGNVSRSHRDAVFNRDASVVGIASGPSPVGRVCVVLFANEYSPIGSGGSGPHGSTSHSYSAPQSQNPSQTTPGSSQAPFSPNPYPQFTIGQLTSAPDNKASLLDISNLGCSISELYVGTRQNGNSLEFSRKSPSGTDSRVFGLPYQVNAASTSATYNPNRNNGELTIRLGKIIPGSAANGDEREVCSYTVNGDASSSVDKVNVKVVQDNSEFYEFLPGQASPYTTQVQVILKESNLLFKSTYDVHEGSGNIITKKITQTIALPTIPASDQIETVPLGQGVIAVRIYHRPRSTASAQHVPDTDIRINLS